MRANNVLSEASVFVTKESINIVSVGFKGLITSVLTPWAVIVLTAVFPEVSLDMIVLAVAALVYGILANTLLPFVTTASLAVKDESVIFAAVRELTAVFPDASLDIIVFAVAALV